MGPITILLLAVVVVGGAYLLGTFLRNRGDQPTDYRALWAERGARRPVEPEVLAKPQAPPAQDEPTHQRLVEWLLTQAFEQTGVSITNDKVACQRIDEAAQQALKELQLRESVSINLPFLTADTSGPKHFKARLTRETLQELAQH